MLTPAFFAPVPEVDVDRPQLFVLVDTEEEFDWSAPFSRENVRVTAIQEVDRLQHTLRPYGLRPTYVVDYPVAASRSSSARLAEIASRGECQIGAHLHPWVTPPFDEPLEPSMSFGCNLGAGLERAKVASLTDAIVANIGVRPRVYKAGRYGFGTTTAEVLEALEFDVDASVIPHMDFSAENGPSFEGFGPGPATFGRSRSLLELPCTTGFIGAARRVGSPLHRAASAPWLRPFRTVGVLARTGTLNKVMLSPEGNRFEEMRDLTRALYQDGLRTFALTLHSPSLKPGCTEYVRSAAEREVLLGTIDRYCDFFLGELGGRPTTPEQLFDDLVGRRTPELEKRTPEPIE